MNGESAEKPPSNTVFGTPETENHLDKAWIAYNLRSNKLFPITITNDQTFYNLLPPSFTGILIITVVKPPINRRSTTLCLRRSTTVINGILMKKDMDLDDSEPEETEISDITGIHRDIKNTC